MFYILLKFSEYEGQSIILIALTCKFKINKSNYI